jgi:hypothetical protein
VKGFRPRIFHNCSLEFEMLVSEASAPANELAPLTAKIPGFVRENRKRTYGTKLKCKKIREEQLDSALERL